MNIQEYFTFDLSPEVWALCAATVACMLYVLLLMVTKLHSVARRVSSDSEADLPERGYPDMSVIVYAPAGSPAIGPLLNDIFAQNYPAETEVIVVTDGSSPESEQIVGILQRERSNLYLTFIPDASRNLSRRKLAITLGVKAARYDTVVLTEADCRIPSDKWLASIGRHFVAGKQLVAGYARLDTSCDTSGAFRLRAFDSVWEAVSWLVPAISGYPHRGIRSNLAYTRQLFFANKGFSNSLNLTNGDDDIFVSEVATARNSAIELSEQSQVVITDDMAAKRHVANKLQRNFTADRIGGIFRQFLGLASGAMWLLIGCGAAASILGWPSLTPLCVCSVVFLVTAICFMVAWRKAALALGSRPLLLTALPLLLWHPFHQLRYRLKGYRNRNRNYTWSC